MGRKKALQRSPTKATVRKSTVELDADVARVFKDAASVNKALRKLIEAMPRPVSAVAKRLPRRKAS